MESAKKRIRLRWSRRRKDEPAAAASLEGVTREEKSCHGPADACIARWRSRAAGSHREGLNSAFGSHAPNGDAASGIQRPAAARFACTRAGSGKSDTFVGEGRAGACPEKQPADFSGTAECLGVAAGHTRSAVDPVANGADRSHGCRYQS